VTVDRSQDGESQLDGTGLGDILIGRNNAADTIRGNGGDDFLSGGSGNDALWGGTGRDAFHFGPNFGHDTVFDFVAGTDLIVIDDSIFANFAEVLDHAADDGQGNTIIAVDAANSITLNNVIKANLSVADFHFV
jgi:Ca2+-binding RTX toxin-like protein